MPYVNRLNFPNGGTIDKVKPGKKIKTVVDEIQRKSIIDIKSAVPGLAFRKKGANSLQLVSSGSSGGGEGLLRTGEIRNDGSAGSAKIRYVGGVYYLDITFPRVNSGGSINFQNASG